MSKLEREYIYHCKRCLVCQASLYPELLPPIQSPTALSDAGEWLSLVRILGRKSAILSRYKGDTALLEILARVSIGEETFRRTVENEYAMSNPKLQLSTITLADLRVNDE